jgi:hypothetical protein
MLATLGPGRRTSCRNSRSDRTPGPPRAMGKKRGRRPIIPFPNTDAWRPVGLPPTSPPESSGSGVNFMPGGSSGKCGLDQGRRNCGRCVGQIPAKACPADGGSTSNCTAATCVPTQRRCQRVGGRKTQNRDAGRGERQIIRNISRHAGGVFGKMANVIRLRWFWARASTTYWRRATFARTN